MKTTINRKSFFQIKPKTEAVLPATSPQNLQPPTVSATEVEVELPARIRIELVQGNELRHYEIFFLTTSLTLSTAVSFWTSYATQASGPILFSAIAFTGLTLVSSFAALYYRSKVYNGKIKKSAPLDSFKIK